MGDEDLRPQKGVYCVWDLLTPGAPVFVLTAPGQPTSCCFSASQAYLLLGATQEGTLHLWDLREPSALHRDRDSRDLAIDKGIRSPCFSTPLALVAAGASGVDGSLVDARQHLSPIERVEAIGESDPVPAAASMFAALDRYCVCACLVFLLLH